MRLYLSRLTLSRQAPAAALMPLLNPREPGKAANAHHRLIWTVFSDSSERERDFLWRYAGRGRFYTLSRRTPRPSELFFPIETKVFDPCLDVGDRLQYMLRANATKDRAAISRLEGAARRKRSRRVDLVMDVLRTVPSGRKRAEIRDQVAQVAGEKWMTHQGSAKGFTPLITVIGGYSTFKLDQRCRRGATIGVVELDGQIEVTDPQVFLSALASGFGRAKAWGCGLMLIRRVQ